MCVSVYWTPINKDKLHLLSSLISPPHPSLSSAAAPLAAHKLLPTAQKVERSLHELYSKLLIIMSISNHWNTSWSFAWSNFQPLKIKVWITILLSTVECSPEWHNNCWYAWQLYGGVAWWGGVSPAPWLMSNCYEYCFLLSSVSAPASSRWRTPASQQSSYPHIFTSTVSTKFRGSQYSENGCHWTFMWMWICPWYVSRRFLTRNRR